MNKFAFVFGLALAASATAQTPNAAVDHGSVIVGGSGSLTRQDQSGGHVTTLSLQPQLLYFVRPRLALGGTLGFTRSSAEGTTSTSWGIGPAVRYFPGAASSTALPFLGLSVPAQTSSTDLSGAGSADANGWGFEPVVGVTWLLASHVGLSGEAFFLRRFLSTKFGGTTQDLANSTYGLRMGITAFVF